MSSPKSGRWGLKPVSFRHRDALSEIDWKAFERLVADYFRDQDYEVEHCGTGGSASSFDGGVDLRLRRGAERVVVQCKHQNAYQVPHNDVHQLVGIKVNEGATGAVIITSGEFTSAAKAAGEHGHIELIDGIGLRNRLGNRLDQLRPSHQSSSPDRLQELLGVVTKEVVRHASRRSRRQQDDLQLLLIKAVAGGLIVLFVMFGLPRVIKRALLPPPRPQPQAVTSPVVAPTSVEPARRQPTFSAVIAPVRVESAEQRAARDAEVKKYLERVPEVTHYRYSPLDQEREPETEQGESER